MGMFKNMFNKSEKENNLPFGSNECGRFLRETYKDSVDEVKILEENVYEKLNEYDEIVENISKLETRKKIIEHILQSEMKECETAFCKERKITWKPVIKSSIDSKVFKDENPELALKYIKVNKSRVFKIR
ncbi:hypothetical protein CHL78_005965 [Romboutsia weinsteinii]|uniref:Uncharacterized protein n=1 Tax=Romboutsia weinsteinii TaxID=2020949 RepID=A0A371J5T0_9FIRM|nr:hypothetical protein [Romboutsia weinsteinii]RDY28140.1 hypothetical protein CHL78_005965 [Romboutsia weinsteinii]